MANPDQRTSYLKKLVSAARSVVTYQTGLPLGCMRLNSILLRMRPFEPPDYPVFADYRLATCELPKSTERLHWNRDALRECDKRLEAINQKFRDRVFDACYDIIDHYGSSPLHPTENA